MEKLSGKVADMTAEEWKELGFFYSSDDDMKRWDLNGSLSGVARLSEELNNFSERDEVFGEHEHLLPHWYLTIEYDEVPDINKRGIVGRKLDLLKLRDYLISIPDNLSSQACFSIHSCFEKTTYEMYFHIENEDFDPSSMDWQLQS